MFTKKDREKIDNTKKYIDHLSRSYDQDNEYLKKMCDNLSGRACKAEIENRELRTKVHLYEKYIQLIKDADVNSIGKVFMFDGELYILKNYCISKEAGETKTLSVDFECLTGVTKNFKERKNDEE